MTIARAIVSDPTFLLCDEPTGDLDRKSADEIMDLIHRAGRSEYKKTVLMVTHDPVVAERARHHASSGERRPGGRRRRQQGVDGGRCGMKFGAPDFRQSFSQEDPPHAHHRLLRRGAVPLRLPGGGQERLQPRRRILPARTGWSSSIAYFIIQPIPLSYRDKILQHPGVKAVTHETGSAASIRTRKTSFPQFAIDVENQRQVYPELVVPDDQWQNFVKDRQGAIAGAGRQTFWLESRRPHSHQERAIRRHGNLGVQSRRHLPRQRRPGRRNAVLVSVGLFRGTHARRHERAWSAGTSCKLNQPGRCGARGQGH